jgi:hypothetical protein
VISRARRDAVVELVQGSTHEAPRGTIALLVEVEGRTGLALGESERRQEGGGEPLTSRAELLLRAYRGREV